jgi:gas vesicle protein
MFSRVKIAIRFFFVGLAVGILLAPRSGLETRRMVRERADRLLNDVLDAATLGTFDSNGNTGNGNDADLTDDAAEATAAKSGNGRTRSRAGSTASAAEAQA